MPKHGGVIMSSLQSREPTQECGLSTHCHISMMDIDSFRLVFITNSWVYVQTLEATLAPRQR
jgi:hypothetical protein